MKEAFNAFSEGREYKQVSPFFDRFDYTIEDDGPPATHDFLNYPLSEIVFSLWDYSRPIFQGFKKYTEEFRKVVRVDRSITSPQTCRENFVKTIGRSLHQENISIISLDLTRFANWVFDNPERCPSIRFGYEVYHKITKNLGDIIKQGDIADFGHINCVPYVDLATFDRRMVSYIIQASKKLGTEYQKKAYVKLEELLKALKSSDTANKAPLHKVSS